MTKLEQMQRVESCGVVAIIRANSSAELIEVAAAIKAGGVDLIEVTMTTPNALSVISDVATRYGDEVLVGVGSVLDAETARAAMLAGAEFVVSPVTKPDVIEICNRYSKIVMPGGIYTDRDSDCMGSRGGLCQSFPVKWCGTKLHQRCEGTAAAYTNDPHRGCES